MVRNELISVLKHVLKQIRLGLGLVRRRVVVNRLEKPATGRLFVGVGLVGNKFHTD